MAHRFLTPRDRNRGSGGEGFVDRSYENNGRLRSRKLDGALITDAKAAAEQAFQIVKNLNVKTYDGTVIPLKVQTLCIHSDTPNAAATAKCVWQRLHGN